MVSSMVTSSKAVRSQVYSCTYYDRETGMYMLC
jgi:hypothetical protein